MALSECAAIDGIVVTAPADMLSPMRMAIGAMGGENLSVVAGGTTRQRSVREGLTAIPADATRILVHDAARPLVTAAMCHDVLDALGDADGAIAATPVADTIKRADGDLLIVETVDRSALWQAQTPQAFDAAVLRRVFAEADDELLDTATDCASMVEESGGRVRLVPSAGTNLKVTSPGDLELAADVLRAAGRMLVD
jgi:2-C-methyl-D-erythritol 4-phosphate cytidylyltransferase